MPMIRRGVEAYVTRLHLRYEKKNFPEDLFFQVTDNTKNFQGRYIMRQAWTKGGTCKGMDAYLERVKQRSQKSAENLAKLTGWEIDSIYKKMKVKAPPPKKEKKWYEKIFK